MSLRRSGWYAHPWTDGFAASSAFETHISSEKQASVDKKIINGLMMPLHCGAYTNKLLLYRQKY